MEEGAKLAIHDPRVSQKNIEFELGIKSKNIDESNSIIMRNGLNKEIYFYWCKNINDTIIGADAVVILTEWNEYKKLNPDLFNENMRKPAWIFDCRDVLNSFQVDKNSINYWRVGKG